MTHRALVERRTDSDGRYDVLTWGTYVAAQPCWLWEKGGVESVAPERTAVVSSISILVPLDADVRPTDRINGVVNRNGVTILGGKVNVLDRLVKHDHALLLCERVTGGNQ